MRKKFIDTDIRDIERSFVTGIQSALDKTGGPEVARLLQEKRRGYKVQTLASEELEHPLVEQIIEKLRAEPAQAITHHGFVASWSASVPSQGPLDDYRAVPCWGNCHGSGFSGNEKEAGAFCLCDLEGYLFVKADWPKILAVPASAVEDENE